jgi:hypothetical protein
MNQPILQVYKHFCRIYAFVIFLESAIIILVTMQEAI